MHTLPTTIRSATCALAVTLALMPLAHATQQAAITNAASAASATGPATTARALSFTTHHAVPAKLTLRRDKPIVSGWKAQFRFAGQTDFATCEFNLPKAGQPVQPGDTATGTITCTTPWQLYDNGLSFEAFEGGRKVADGTLRP